MILDVLLPLLGALLLVLLLYDVLVTVFHPQGHGGPINRVQNRGVWMLFRRVGRGRDGRPRKRLLGFCGPLLAMLTIAIWGAVLIVAFGLIYHPFIDAFPMTPGSEGRSWVKTLYYSGFVASSLGIGDVVPPGSALRLLTVAQAMGGFVLVTVSVTYVLGVYNMLGRASTLALDVSGYLRDGAGEVLDAMAADDPAAFRGWADRTARGLNEVTQAHSQYPILHYFYSTDPSAALQLRLGELIRLVRHLDEREEGSRSPSLDALRVALREHLLSIDRDLVPDGFEPGPGSSSDATLEERHRRILRFMLHATERG